MSTMPARTSRAAFSRRQVVCLSATAAAAAMLAGLPHVGVAAESQGTPEAREGLSFTPGTYEGAGTGRGGELLVSVEFSEDAIVSVTVTEHDETPYISDLALERIPAEIVAHQSTGIDGVTGASLTSGAIIAAVEDAAEQAGADLAALRAYEAPAPSTETVELDCDIAIAGAGGAGMACAVAAAQAGKKVVVLEKASNMGGNALVSGGWLEYIYAPESMRLEMTDAYRSYFEQILQNAQDGGAAQEFLDAVRADYDAWYDEGHTTVYDSTGLYRLELGVSDGLGFADVTADMPVNDPEDAGPQLNEWLDSMGIVWKEPLTGIVGYPWPHWTGVKDARNGQGYFDLYSAEIEKSELPVQLVTLTPASEVIMGDGRATGLKGVSDDGTTYVVHASEAVILATGGYSGSPDMLREYDETWGWTEDDVIPTTNAYGHTGDGITMGLAVGGCVGEMGYPMVFPFADAKNWSTETIVGDTGSCLAVNTEGKRFVNEAADRYSISAALMQQPDQKLYIISDAQNNMCTDGKTEFGADMAKLLANGQLFEADTLEELAEQIGIDPEVLVQTVEHYNDLVAGAADEEFGRSAFKDNSAITEPPFYASPRTWAAHITIGGLMVDEEGCVLTEAGEKIESLYAVGETAVNDCGITVMGKGLSLARRLSA